MSSVTLRDLCKAGDVEAVRLHLLQQQPLPELDVAMGMAARYGHISIVQMLINQGANEWNWGLYNAVEGGHMPVVLQMIDKGADDWNEGLYHAAECGHMHIVQLMIERGANDWNGGLYHAAEGGHMPIVMLMIERGANEWNRGLCAAAEGGHMSIVQLMIDKGANGWYWGLYYAALGGHIPIVLLMIERGANKWSAVAVLLLQSHPFEIIHLSRCGLVSQHLFAEHSPLFEQWIREDEQVRTRARALLLPSSLNDDAAVTLLPRDLCELALLY